MIIETATGTLPSLWRAAVETDDGGTTYHLVVARDKQEAVRLLVEPGHDHLIRRVYRLGTIPFGPGVVA